MSKLSARVEISPRSRFDGLNRLYVLVSQIPWKKPRSPSPSGVPSSDSLCQPILHFFLPALPASEDSHILQHAPNDCILYSCHHNR
jgi:hypothetical protein